MSRLKKTEDSCCATGDFKKELRKCSHCRTESKGLKVNEVGKAFCEECEDWFDSGLPDDIDNEFDDVF